MGARTRTKLLEAPGVNFGDVEVPFLVGAYAVHTPQRAREIANRPPRVDEASVQVVLQHLVSFRDTDARPDAGGGDAIIRLFD